MSHSGGLDVNEVLDTEGYEDATEASIVEEYKIAMKLRKSCEEKDGKWSETNPAESATYFRMLGTLYAARNDKISLISAAGLFMAAIVRTIPDVTGVRNEMEILWEKILSESKAQNTTKFHEISQRVRKSVDKIRAEARDRLLQIPQVNDKSNKLNREEAKARDVRKLQSEINSKLISLLEEISKYCTSVLFGKNQIPDFALLALGSLAREEASPYSDIESIIVLSDDVGDDVLMETVEQFRWYAVMYQVIIISLGESPLRLLGIKSLNDFYSKGKTRDWFYDNFTPSGIQFDSNMPSASIFPLGRRPTPNKPFKTELIRRVSDMVTYVDSNFSADNGYHLANVLAKSKFIAGNIRLHEQYTTLVNKRLKEQSDDILLRISQTIETFDSFDILCRQPEFGNVKGLMYRLMPLLIGYLGNILSISGTSCFDTLDKFCAEGVITKVARHNLSYALAVAGEVRWKVYEKAKQQVPIVGVLPSQFSSATEESSELLNTVGKTSILDFFDIVRCFWHALVAVNRDPTANNNNRNLTENLSNSPMRGASDVALIALFASLNLQLDKPLELELIQPLKTPNAPVVKDLSQVIIMVTDKLKILVAYMNKIFVSHNDNQISGLTIFETLTHNHSQLLIGVQAAKDGFLNNDSSSITHILAKLFGPDFYHAELETLERVMVQLQDLTKSFFGDQSAITNMPILLVNVFLLASSSATIQRLGEEVAAKKLTKDTVQSTFSDLDKILRLQNDLVTDIRQNCPSMTDFSLTEYGLELTSKWTSDGSPALNSLKLLTQKWPDEILLNTKGKLLSTNSGDFWQAIEKVHDVIRFIQGVPDWSMLVGLAGELTVRELESVARLIQRIRGDYFFKVNNFVEAQRFYKEELSILKRNCVERGRYRALVGTAKKSIACCALELGIYKEALELFQKEIFYRLEYATARTSAEEIAENFINQSRCYSGLGQDLEADFYFRNAGGILENGIWTKREF